MMTKTLWITTSWHRPEALCLMGGTCCSRQRAARLCSASTSVTNQLLFPLDLVLYCEAFLTTYRTFITPEELIKKLQYRYPSGPHPGPHLTHSAFHSSSPGESGVFLPTQPPRGGQRVGLLSPALPCPIWDLRPAFLFEPLARL